MTQVQLQKKMEFDSTSLDTEVKKTFQAKIKEIKIQRCDLGHMLSSKESIKSRADTLLNHLKDVNLLLQLQGDLMATLDHHQECRSKITLVPLLKKDLQYVHHEDNMVATFKDEGKMVLHMYEKIEALETENKKHVQNKQQDGAEIQRLKNELEDAKKKSSKLSGELVTEKEKSLHNLKQRDARISRQQKQIQILETEKHKEVIQLRRNHQEYEFEVDKVKKLTDMTEQRNTVLGECQQALILQNPNLRYHLGLQHEQHEGDRVPRVRTNRGSLGMTLLRHQEIHGTLIEKITELINEPIDFLKKKY